MTPRDATLTFAQADGIKSGLIWATTLVEQLPALTEAERRGAVKVLTRLIELIGNEVQLAGRLTPGISWDVAEKEVDLALVMIRSGVAMEATYHLTRALSRVTDMAQRALSVLKARGLA